MSPRVLICIGLLIGSLVSCSDEPGAGAAPPTVAPSVVQDGVELRLVLGSDEVRPGKAVSAQLQLVNMGTEAFVDRECDVSRSRFGLRTADSVETMWTSSYDTDCGGIVVEPGDALPPLTLCFRATDASGAPLREGGYTAVVEVAPGWSTRLEAPISVDAGAEDEAEPRLCR